MNNQLTFGAAVLAAISITSCDQEKQDDRPNIIVIMADDMGYSDIGAFGSEINTPNLDRLAANGMVMTHFYNTGRCCPSRAALLTGLYQHQTGIGDMGRDDGIPAYRGFLNSNCVTIAEVLKEAGYTTWMTGKWHVGSQKEHWPLQRGFDGFLGYPRGGGVYFYPFRSGRATVLGNEEIHPDPGTFYSTDAINDYAVKFIKQAQDSAKPFFLYVAHIAPHFPLQAWEEDIQKYRGKYLRNWQEFRKKRFQTMNAKGILEKGTVLSEPDERVLDWDTLSAEEKDEFDLRMAIYAAQIDRMDQGIGHILDHLEKEGLMENTLIMFFSDNGGCHENSSAWLDDTASLGRPGCGASYLPSWANVSNTPFRMYKHWVHEGGIASPCIIHYPEVIKDHRIDRSVAHIMDIMPSCIDLAGGTYPKEYHGHEIKPLEGKSLVPIIRGDEREGYKWLFWEHEGNRAARQGDWKLVLKYPENVWRLYDLSEDPTELIDLSTEYPERKQDMILAWEEWAERVGAVPYDSILELRRIIK